MDKNKLGIILGDIALISPSKDTHRLWNRMLSNLYFLKEKNDKVTFLKKEINERINILENKKGASLIFRMVRNKSVDRDKTSFTNSFLLYFLSDLVLDEKDWVLYSNFYNSFFNTKGEDDTTIHWGGQIVKYKSKALILPKIDLFIDIWQEMTYLDHLYYNIFAVKNDKPPLDFQDKVSSTKLIIKQEFNSINETEWDEIFLFHEDYCLFCDLLTNYFEQNEYTLPQHSIKLKSRKKTKMSRVLHAIYDSLGETLASDVEFLNIIRVLQPFSENTDNKQLAKIIQKHI